MPGPVVCVVDLPRDLTGQLSGQLSGLTEVLDDPFTDLRAVLDVLADDLTAAIPSFLGLRITVHLAGTPVTVTAGSLAAARASLHLPARSVSAAFQGGSVVFYAGNPGAFVDLAADAHRLPGMDGQLILDGHLPGTGEPDPTPGVTGLDELRVINQAVGVLITRGHTPAQAHAVLEESAARDRRSVADTARHLLTSHPTATAPPLTTPWGW